MNVKERIHELVDVLPEDEETLVLQILESFTRRRGIERTRSLPYEDTPANFTKNFGVWEDDRSTEEIIRDIYDHREKQAGLRRVAEL